MTPAEQGEAPRAAGQGGHRSGRAAASQALDDLMGKLLVIRRLLEAEERLPTRAPRADPM